MKRYKKPRFTIIKLSIENLMQIEVTSNEDPAEELDAKAQNFRIFDDSFDDEMSSVKGFGYTKTNSIEVW